MANTTQRTVELQIKLQGVQTLEQLEQVTSDINSELKNIPINSKAFSEMESLAKKANSQIKQIDENLAGVTNVQKTESLFKLGEGLAGAFAIASSASLVFGEKTSAELEKTIAKVGALVIALDGVKKISEAFSAENLRGLKGVVNGFKESSIAAKLFGTTARTALVSTGIGALIVILGLIIANWDKVKAATVKAFNALKDYVPIFKIIDIAIEGIQKKFGNLKAFIAGVGAGIKAAFTFGASINESFDKAVKQSLALQAIDKELLNLTTKRKSEMDNINEILAAQGGKELEIYNNQIKYNKELVDAYNTKAKTAKLNEEEQKLLDESVQNIKVLSAQRTKYNSDQAKAAAEQKKAAAEKAADDKNKLLEEQKRIEELKLNAIKAEQEFRKTINDLELEKESLMREGLIIKLTTDLDSKYTEEYISDEINKLIDQVHAGIQEEGAKRATTEITFQLREEIANKLRSIDLNDIEITKIEEISAAKVKQSKIIEAQIKDAEDWLVFVGEDYETEIKLAELRNKQLENLNDIAKSEQDIKNIRNENVDVLGTISESIFNATKITSKLKKTWEDLKADPKQFLEDNMETIQAAAQLTNQLFELQIAQLERKAELEKRNLDDIQAKKQGYADQDKSLNDLLADAEGQRYLDILSQIEANAQAQQANANAEIESKRKINAYELKAAKARKTQAIVDATIQGALGVVEALPNIFLAALVGALTLASIATIASQPNPEPIALATGGIVKGNSYQGDKVNAKLNSGEMVLNTDQQANLFKQINTKPNVSNNYSSMIDYDLLANKIGDVFAANPQYVSVVEINNAQNKLKVVQNRASIIT